MSRLLNRLWATARVLRTMGASATLLALPQEKTVEPLAGGQTTEELLFGVPHPWL